MTWSAKGTRYPPRFQAAANVLTAVGSDGIRPAGYIRADDGDADARHVRLVDVATGETFPVCVVDIVVPPS